MRFSEIIKEAPLADIETHGEPLDKPGSFSAVDRGYIKHNILNGVYKKSLKGLPFNLYIYVLNAAGLEELGKEYPEGEINFRRGKIVSNKNRGVFSSTDAGTSLPKQTLEPVIQAIEINKQKDPSAVHFIIGDNFSQEGQITPTPWIIVHRLMHAVLPDDSDDDAFADIIFSAIQISGLSASKFANTFFTFKSSVSGNLQISEIGAELATQFLLTGGNPLRNLDKLRPRQSAELQNLIKQFQRKIEQLIESAAGKIFYI